MKKRDIPKLLENSISSYERYCDGYGSSNGGKGSYILGVNLGVGIVNKTFGHKGSTLLDEINSFDVAEIDGAYIGQLNMSIVSSFCGPQGLIWGYDIAKHDKLYTHPKRTTFPRTVTHKGKRLKVYDGEKLVDATKRLFGTVDDRNFNIIPGAHVPFAGKNKKITEAGVIYAGIAIGIPKNRYRDACLLMEDVGEIKEDLLKLKNPEDEIRRRLAKSLIEIGNNQRVSFKECFVAVKKAVISEGQVGCTLVAAPYFTLASNALLKDKTGELDFKAMEKIPLSLWEKLINGKK